MDRQFLITEAKERIKRSLLKDTLIIFFTRVVEDLKRDDDPNVFGRFKELYILLNPYGALHEHVMYDFFKDSVTSEFGIELDEEEQHYLRIVFDELTRDFHLKNPKVMKGRMNGMLTKLCEKYLGESSKIIEPFLLGRIISAVGGTERLFRMPSSTIQLIGAEQALFRHMSGKHPSPKYGLLYYSKFVQAEKKKGKKARELANKLAISIKVDYIRHIYVNPR